MDRAGPQALTLRIPTEPWPWLRLLTTLGTIALAATCWAEPQVGLPILWGFVIPVLPLLWALLPGLWRNVCPMASVNQLPRLARLSAGRRLPTWLEQYGYAIGAVTFIGAVALRPSVLEVDGRASAAMLLVALLAAFIGGTIYAGKSGFCGSVCPLRPTQTLYARSPTVLVEHAHCKPCLGCTPNCQDLLPKRSLMADLRAGGPSAQARWSFAGLLPGITLGFAAIPNGTHPLPALFSLLTAGLLSLGLLALAEAFSGLDRNRLTAVWSAAALIAFVWANLPKTALALQMLWGIDVGEAAIWEGRIIMVLVAGAWFGRSLALARAEGASAAAPTALPMASAAAIAAPTLQLSQGAAPASAVRTPSVSGAPRAQVVAAAVAADLSGTLTDATGMPLQELPIASATPIVAGEPPVQIPDRRAPDRPDRAPTVVFWPSGTVVSITPDTSTVAAAARSVGIAIPEGCGTGLCGCDPIYIRSGADGLAPAGAQERATLSRLGLPAHARLACSSVVVGDVAVSLEPIEAAPATESPIAPVSPPSTPAPAVPTPVPAPVAAPAAPVPTPAPVPASPVVVPDPRPLAPVGARKAERVVVIGNGVAGVTAASHLRSLDANLGIDLVSRSPHPFYNRIAIARLIHQPQGLGSLQLMPDRWYAEHKVTQWLNTSVAGVDRGSREVVLGTGQVLPYDALILATGARWAAPSIPGLNLPGAFGLREASDAMHIRAYAQRRRAARAVVLGGGLLGLEVAEALHKLGLEVMVLERGAGLSEHVLDARGSALLQRAVERSGVQVRTSATVIGIDGEERVRGVRLAGGEVLRADLVVCCVGIQPHTELASDAGLAVGRGIVVDEQMRTSDPRILACGDAAEFDGKVGGHWAVGAAQAEVAAVNALGGVRSYRATPVPTVLKLGSLEVVSVGDVRGGNGIRAVAAPTNDDTRHQVTFFAGDRPVGLVGINAGPEIDPFVDAIVHGTGGAGAGAAAPAKLPRAS